MTGVGRRRRTRLDTRPRRTALVAVLSVAVVGAVPVLVWKGARTIVDSNEGSTVTVRAVPAAQIPPTPVAMLVIVGGDGRASSFVLVSRLPKSEGGFVIQVPADMRVAIPGFGEERIATAFDTGGLDLAQQTMQAAMQITIDVAAEANASQLADLLAPYEPFAMHFDQPVLASTSDGRTDTVFPAGDATLRASDVPKLLLARLSDGVEADVLARQEAMWRAVIAAVKAKRGKAGSTDIAGFIGGLSQGTYVATTLALDVAHASDHLPGVPPDLIRMRLLVAEAMPGAVSPSSSSARYRIVNTTGDPLLALDVVGRLTYFGANIIAAGDTTEKVGMTKIAYVDDSNKTLATSLTHILETGKAVKTTDRVEGIDITITIGTDYAAVVRRAKDREAALPTSTAPASTQTDSTTSTTI
jgi:hypothetical protein